MKKCSRCKIEKTLSEFYTCKRIRSGYQYHCKLCNNQYKKKKYVKQSIYTDKEKQCSVCKQILNHENFYQSAITDDKLFDKCKKCCYTRFNSAEDIKKRNRYHYNQYWNAEITD